MPWNNGNIVLWRENSDLPYYKPDEIIPLIEERVTITGLVPAMANMCIEFLEMDEYDISSLKLIQIGGSVLDQITAKKIERGFFVSFSKFLELLKRLISTTSLDDDSETIYNTQGKPISEYDEVLIVDEEAERITCRGVWRTYS